MIALYYLVQENILLLKDAPYVDSESSSEVPLKALVNVSKKRWTDPPCHHVLWTKSLHFNWAMGSMANYILVITRGYIH